jgi:hypothetical protein
VIDRRWAEYGGMFGGRTFDTKNELLSRQPSSDSVHFWDEIGWLKAAALYVVLSTFTRAVFLIP